MHVGVKPVTENLSPLTYAVRPRVVAKYLGQLMIMLALLTMAPLAVSLIFSEFGSSIRLAIVIAILLATGIPAAKLAPPRQIQTNEALVVVVGTFLITAALLTFPLMEHGVAFQDALFEAVSAVTTTGLSTLPTLDGRSHTFLFLRAWMQWFGGLGIAVLSVALLMSHNIANRQLTEPVSGENLVTTARAYARRIVTVYLTLTLTAILLLRLFTDDTMTAVDYILATVSTGGFSPIDGGLTTGVHWEARYCIMLFAFLGAVPLALYYHLFRRDWRKVLGDVEVRGLLGATLVSIALLWLCMPEHAGISPLETLAHTVFTAVSAQTTTGFSTMDINAVGPAAKCVLILSMALGGCIGSTAGGIKILRLLIVLRLIQLALNRTALTSHAVVTNKLGGRPLDSDDMIRALLLIILFIIVVVVSWLAFVANGYNPLDSLFEVVSATGTVGLSTGITRTTLGPALKAVLCADMLMGRLEVIALLVILYPKTWIGKRTEST